MIAAAVVPTGNSAAANRGGDVWTRPSDDVVELIKLTLSVCLFLDLKHRHLNVITIGVPATTGHSRGVFY
jgi:hypothetical protein